MGKATHGQPRGCGPDVAFAALREVEARCQDDSDDASEAHDNMPDVKIPEQGGSEMTPRGDGDPKGLKP